MEEEDPDEILIWEFSGQILSLLQIKFRISVVSY
jgi:hypothetical protein